MSIEVPLVDGEDNSLFDLLENYIKLGNDGSLANNESLIKQIDRILSILTDRQKDVIKLHYGIGTKYQMSLEDIGEKFGFKILSEFRTILFAQHTLCAIEHAQSFSKENYY